MILIEVAEACRDNPDEPQGNLGGAVEEPADDSDVYRELAAERAAIKSRFSSLLKTASPTARRAIKDARNAAMAGAKWRAKNEISGRKKLRKDRKLRPIVRRGQVRRL
jgi:hypothetical protein